MKGAYYMSANKKTSNIYTICAMALLIAMMVLLKKVGAIETPYFKFSFSSLPIVLAAMMFGPGEGAVVAVVGEFIAQITGPYGLMPTTFIYIWPPAVRALVVGGVAVFLRRQRGCRLDEQPVICYVTCIIAAVLTTTANTAAIWVESVFYDLSFTPSLFFVPARYTTGVLTAVLIATVCIPVMRGLRRSGLLKYAE